MPGFPSPEVVRRLRPGAHPADRPDADLLHSYAAGRDEAAFEALVRRHGPMVLGVCRHWLRNSHDAEDAFQVAFLVLARKAGSLRQPERLPCWLYGVATNTALKARAMNERRRAKEKEAAARRPTETPPEDGCLVQASSEGFGRTAGIL